MKLIDAIQKKPLILDGSMYTMIYEKGVFINTCYEQLCITNPELISEIHNDYANAGADIIKTNSFGANRIKLEPHGLAEKLVLINTTAVKLARKAASENQWVVGSIGPCLNSNQHYDENRSDKLKLIFEEQMQALADEGIDGFFLETFSHSKELLLAAKIAKTYKLPVFASVTVGKDGETRSGEKIKNIIQILDKADEIDAIGINSGLGPAAAFSITERVISLTTKPFTVLANAGLPQEVNGRLIYMSTPEYFSEYAKKLIEIGVKVVGGDCGTTPKHINTLSKQVKPLSGAKKHIEIVKQVENAQQVDIIKMSHKSKFAHKLVNGKKVSSVEITPPRSIDLKSMLDKCEVCKNANVDVINIPDGPRASARISSMVAALEIERQIGIETILHYCCRDRNLIGMQSDLLGGYAGGLHNYLIITGDPPKLGDYPDSTAVFDVDAVGLTQVVKNLNRGIDVGGNIINPPTGILIGVGANPCAIDPKRELNHYLNKINAGAEYAITQPIFDAQALLKFLDDVEKNINPIPIVAGIWPLVSLRNAEFLKNEVPGVEIPDAILERMSKAKTKEEGRTLGIDIAREIRDEISDRVAGFQVSAPFGIIDLALQVLD